MKTSLTLVVLFLWAMPLFCDEGIQPITTDLPRAFDSSCMGSNELAQLEVLIQATEKSLCQQKALRTLIERYQEVQQRYMEHSDDDELLYQVIKAAYTALQSINENHLNHNFEPEFIDELSLFAKFKGKRKAS